MSLYRPTFHATLIDLCMYSNVNYNELILLIDNYVAKNLLGGL